MYTDINIAGKYKNIIRYKMMSLLASTSQEIIDFSNMMMEELDPFVPPNTTVSLDCYTISFSIIFMSSMYFSINVREHIIISIPGYEASDLHHQSYSIADPESIPKTLAYIKKFLGGSKELYEEVTSI